MRLMLDADLRQKLQRIFAEADALAKNLDSPYALDYLQRHIAEAEEVMQEHGRRLASRPNFIIFGRSE